MNNIDKKEGILYTQNADVPIEERVFFREGKGVTATSEHYRIATPEEIAAWENWRAWQQTIEEPLSAGIM